MSAEDVTPRIHSGQLQLPRSEYEEDGDGFGETGRAVQRVLPSVVLSRGF